MTPRDRAAGPMIPQLYHLTWKRALTILLVACVFLLMRMWMLPTLWIRFALGALGISAFVLTLPRSRVMVLLAPIVFTATSTFTFDWGSFYPSAPKIIMAGILVFYILEKVVWNESPPLRTPQMKLLGLFVLTLAVSCVTSIHLIGQHPLNAVREALTYITFAPLMIMVADLFSTRRSLAAMTAVLIAVYFAAALVGVLEYNTATTFYRTDMGIGYVFSTRVASIMGNPNVFAGYLELTTPLALALAIYHRRTWVRVSALAITIAGVLSTLYTFSRGGLISLVIGCGIVLFYRFRRRIWVPVTVLIVFVLFLGATAGIFERQVNFFTNPTETITQPTLLHRYFSYRSVFREFTESPLLGEGWGARPFFWGRTRLYSFWEIRHTVSHVQIDKFGGLNSFYLTFLVKAGLVGAMALLILLLMVATTCLRAIRHADPIWGIGIAGGMVAFLGHQTMDNFLQWHFVAPFFWIHLGLATAAARVGSHRKGGA